MKVECEKEKMAYDDLLKENKILLKMIVRYFSLSNSMINNFTSLFVKSNI